MPEGDGRPTDRMRAEHAKIRRQASGLAHAASSVGSWSDDVRAELDGVRAFLAGLLVPHAAAEEAVLYPMMDKVMGVEQATATMAADHRAIQARATAVLDLIANVGAGPPTPPQAEAMREHLYGLWAIVDLHLDKEEEILFSILDERLTPADVRTLMEKLEESQQ
jgi:iron-sulfur cluster repair protein YtfE (RIC family)